MTEPILEVEDLHAHIGQHHVLQGVSLRVRRDAVTVLLGRNGAGKTTTMRTIVGLLHPSRGSVRFEGRPIHTRPPYDIVRLGIGFVPEGQGIFAGLTVDENLRVATLDEGPGSRARLGRVFELFPALEQFRQARAGTGACEIVFCAQLLHFWLQDSFQGCKIRRRQFRNERKKQTGNGLVPLQLRLKSNVDPYNLSETERFLQ